jgi:hypothetical protein
MLQGSDCREMSKAGACIPGVIGQQGWVASSQCSVHYGRCCHKGSLGVRAPYDLRPCSLGGCDSLPFSSLLCLGNLNSSHRLWMNSLYCNTQVSEPCCVALAWCSLSIVAMVHWQHFLSLGITHSGWHSNRVGRHCDAQLWKEKVKNL